LFLVGSVTTLSDAEKVLEVADAVVLGRQMLADPDWPIKVRYNLPIRPCIRCNQMCRFLSTREVRCDVNPELGWEILPPLEREGGGGGGEGKGEVKIVGGGVMGMEMARVLSLRGFEVILYEKGALGGQLNEIKDPYKKEEFSKLIEYYEKELKRLGVKILLNTEGKEGIVAVPKERQPAFKHYENKTILVNSNLYAYQDYAFEWIKNNEVYVTQNVFKGLDRNRAYLLEEKYRELGVKIVKDRVKADVVIDDVRKTQPSIGQSIAKGYWIARNFHGVW
jgi:tRNA-dihydrouridine synthase